MADFYKPNFCGLATDGSSHITLRYFLVNTENLILPKEEKISSHRFES